MPPTPAEMPDDPDTGVHSGPIALLRPAQKWEKSAPKCPARS